MQGIAAVARSALKDVGENGQLRAEVEEFISDRFGLMHKACIRQFMPRLLCMRGPQGQVLAACGLRDARAEVLFLEKYLHAPVQAVLSRTTGRPQLREGIVEVGNLAVAAPASARDLIVALTENLADTAFKWTVFTALPALRNAFRRLGIEVIDLGEAPIEALPPHEWSDWGNYYAGGPRVCAVSVAGAAAAICALGKIAA